jgi:hypothetical protein
MLKFFIVILIVSLLISCNNSQNNENKTATDTTAAEKKPAGITTFYKLPSPVELFMFLHDANLKYKNQVLNPLDNVNKYITVNSKAINLGIYTSDVVYSTVFEENQQTLKYFTVSKKLAEEMNLMEGFNEKTIKSIDKNINNKDSLFNIINNSFSEITNLFQDKSKSKLLPLIVTGAWVESVYIAINSVGKFSTDDKMIIRIAEQQLLLENLVEFYKSLKPEDLNKEIFDQLLDLKKSFDKLYKNKNVVITKDQFEEISKKINTLRAGFISK